MENGEKGRAPSLDDVMRAVLPEDIPMHPDHPMQQAEPAPSKYSDVVSDGGMDPRNAPAPAQDEREIAELIDQRDNAEDWANKLSAAIASHTGAYIGEHSNMNCPWANALEAIENTRPAQTEQQPLMWRRVVDRLIANVEIFDERPRPICRDCADRNGICESGLDCDIRALVKEARAMIAAPIAHTAPQPEHSGPDTKRLEWMIAERCIIESQNGIGSPTVYRVVWPSLGEAQSEWYPTEREAIDSARGGRYE